MGELISGKEALIALANGEDVEFFHNNCWSWVGEMIVVKHFVNDAFEFRLKPRTITINGIEVPAPFDPKEDCDVFILNDSRSDGYQSYDFDVTDTEAVFFGLWRTEEEIKQVVAALRSVLGKK